MSPQCCRFLCRKNIVATTAIAATQTTPMDIAETRVAEEAAARGTEVAVVEWVSDCEAQIAISAAAGNNSTISYVLHTA